MTIAHGDADHQRFPGVLRLVPPGPRKRGGVSSIRHMRAVVRFRLFVDGRRRSPGDCLWGKRSVWAALTKREAESASRDASRACALVETELIKHRL